MWKVTSLTPIEVIPLLRKNLSHQVKFGNLQKSLQIKQNFKAENAQVEDTNERLSGEVIKLNMIYKMSWPL